MKYISLLIIILVISACSSKPYIVEPVPGDITAGNNEIYVVNHGWHTGIVIPARLIQRRVPELKKRFKEIQYIEFGWGDQTFYQAEEVTTGLTLRAILWPTDSVLHVTAIPIKADEYYPGIQAENICLNDGDYSRLVRFIENSFDKNDSGEIVALEKGAYRDSQFYQSVGDYFLMNTCNTWTAKALKSAGMDIFTFSKLTASGVMDVVVENIRANAREGCRNWN